jgi:hypothetical protein
MWQPIYRPAVAATSEAQAATGITRGKPFWLHDVKELFLTAQGSRDA